MKPFIMKKGDHVRVHVSVTDHGDNILILTNYSEHVQAICFHGNIVTGKIAENVPAICCGDNIVTGEVDYADRR